MLAAGFLIVAVAKYKQMTRAAVEECVSKYSMIYKHSYDFEVLLIRILCC